MRRLALLALLLLSGCSGLSRKAGEGFQAALSSSQALPVRLEQMRSACTDGATAACFLAAPNASAVKAALASDPVAVAAADNSVVILQGPTNSHHSAMMVMTPSSITPTFAYFTEAQTPLASLRRVSPEHVRSVKSPDGRWTVHQFTAAELSLASASILIVANQYGKLIDRRRFKALDLKQKRARIALTSCAYDKYKDESQVMWRALLAARPDLLLMIGDNVYADVVGGKAKIPADPETLWRRYLETFLLLDVYRAVNLVPVLATWDDHDSGANDSGSGNPHLPASKAIFETFFPQRLNEAIPELAKGPGVASRFDAFGRRLLLLDDRTFRTKNRAPDEAQTHFGEEQENWLLQNLKASNEPAWLISGDQWFGAYHPFESYEGNHPLSFARFMNRLKATGRMVAFFSGDRHLSEVMTIEKQQLGYQTYEFTSSSIHSRMFPSRWKEVPNKRHLMGIDLHHSFMLHEIAPIERLKSNQVRMRMKLKGSAIGAASETLFAFDLLVSN